MDSKLRDQAYHRSRVDAHIQGSILFVVLIAGLAFLIGDKFKPFQQGANFWSPTLLLWRPETRVWQTAEQIWATGEVMDTRDKYLLTPMSDAENDASPAAGLAKEYLITKVEPSIGGTLVTKEIHPISYSIVFVFGSLFAWVFLYLCARRQTRLMCSVFAPNESIRPYDRPWEEIRVTFWALFMVLMVELFLFLL